MCSSRWREGKFAGCVDWLGSLSSRVESIARGEGGIRDDYSGRFEACRVESTNGRIVKWASWKRPARVTPPSSAYQARTEGERIDGAALQSHLNF